EYAENLQREIEADTGIRFGIVEQHQFAAIVTYPEGEEGPAVALGMEASKVLWEALRTTGYIDAKGKVQDALKRALREGQVALPEEFTEQKAAIVETLRKVSGRL